MFRGHMRTKVSLLQVSDSATGPSSRKRDVHKEYGLKKGQEKSYAPGDNVLIRNGDGQPFYLRGEVIGRIGKYTYEVRGYKSNRIKKYNQRNLKPIPSDTGVQGNKDDIEHAISEYDKVGSHTTSNTSHIQTPNTTRTRHSYSLRERRTVPGFYKE